MLAEDITFCLWYISIGLMNTMSSVSIPYLDMADTFMSLQKFMTSMSVLFTQCEEYELFTLEHIAAFYLCIFYK